MTIATLKTNIRHVDRENIITGFIVIMFNSLSEQVMRTSVPSNMHTGFCTRFCCDDIIGPFY